MSTVQLYKIGQHMPVLIYICQNCTALPVRNACCCCLKAFCCFNAASHSNTECHSMLWFCNKQSFIKHHSPWLPRQGGQHRLQRALLPMLVGPAPAPWASPFFPGHLESWYPMKSMISYVNTWYHSCSMISYCKLWYHTLQSIYDFIYDVICIWYHMLLIWYHNT